MIFGLFWFSIGCGGVNVLCLWLQQVSKIAKFAIIKICRLSTMERVHTRHEAHSYIMTDFEKFSIRMGQRGLLVDIIICNSCLTQPARSKTIEARPGHGFREAVTALLMWYVVTKQCDTPRKKSKNVVKGRGNVVTSDDGMDLREPTIGAKNQVANWGLCHLPINVLRFSVGNVVRIMYWYVNNLGNETIVFVYTNFV